MDSITRAQDVNRCEFCDENMVDMLCVVCPLMQTMQSLCWKSSI